MDSLFSKISSFNRGYNFFVGNQQLRALVVCCERETDTVAAVLPHW